MLPILMTGRAAVAEGEMRVTALDVGQGTAVLVETRRHALLYDAGPAYVSGTSAGGQVVVPFLRASGVRRLDMLMVSHEDADHAGGVSDGMQAVPIGSRLTAAPPGHRLLAGGVGADWDPCVSGAGWQWDGVRFDILHPTTEELAAGRLQSNARSCVLRVATARRSVLLTGDIGVREELGLIGRHTPDALRADILLVPNHGSGTSSHVAFLRAVRPELAIFQLGFVNRYRHPREDVWRHYERAGVARYRTDETGAVSIVTSGDAREAVPYRQRYRRYWRDGPPAPR
ncbi:ComEC/Rec2 family competence protein [Cupriavidus pauculus]|uniref:ComEC/Rec2 family competence protein n=1 Tax=Cupriavidus pauculus TaxID=82633 RepID=UPI002155271D|nr:ComEC/Rec2 family competence protein [Cupriavidus pauculus]